MSKLNVVLAKTDHLASIFKKSIEDYVKFFKANQGAFKGERKTYEPKPGTVDIPGQRLNKLIVTTVDDKLDWIVDNSKEYIDALFSQEKTNASGTAKAHLKVGDVDFGDLTSLELLRLKNLLENGTFKEMYENIPVRNDDEQWSPTTNESYVGKPVFESNELKGVQKSMLKEAYILPDPNISKIDASKYTPQISQKDTVIELGDFTHQRYSGEYSHVQRAAILQKRSKLLVAVIEALKESNEVEAVPSTLTADKIFGYLHEPSK